MNVYGAARPLVLLAVVFGALPLGGVWHEGGRRLRHRLLSWPVAYSFALCVCSMLTSLDTTKKNRWWILLEPYYEVRTMAVWWSSVRVARKFPTLIEALQTFDEFFPGKNDVIEGAATAVFTLLVIAGYYYSSALLYLPAKAIFSGATPCAIRLSFISLFFFMCAKTRRRFLEVAKLCARTHDVAQASKNISKNLIRNHEGNVSHFSRQ